MIFKKLGLKILGCFVLGGGFFMIFIWPMVFEALVLGLAYWLWAEKKFVFVPIGMVALTLPRFLFLAYANYSIVRDGMKS